MKINIDLKIGNSIVLETIPTRNSVPSRVIESNISKVGNKYFEVEGIKGKFEKDGYNFVTQYSGGYKVHKDIESYNQVKKRHMQLSSIKKVFSSYGDVNLSNEQLNDIYQIINKDE